MHGSAFAIVIGGGMTLLHPAGIGERDSNASR